MRLPELAADLAGALGVQQKREIQAASRHLPTPCQGPWGTGPVRLGDDCAAIPDGDGYLLFAAEGMLPALVASEPRFAAFCAILVNASDVYAMGGRPLAVVDALFSTSAAAAVPMWEGLTEAAQRLGVPVVGGHTNLSSPYLGLAAAVVGRARRLLTSFDARAGDDLIAAVDLRGQMHPVHPFWNATHDAAPGRLRGDYEVLPRLAEVGLCVAAKDISMGGLVGTTLMLLEGSAVGASLWLEEIPRPANIPWHTWLLTFPSYGFVLAVPPKNSGKVLADFGQRHIAAAVIGKVNSSRQLTLISGGERAEVWDFAHRPLTGWTGPAA
jgi:uncharacterized protein